MPTKQERVDALVAQHDGAIKYGQMIDELGTAKKNPFTGEVRTTALDDASILAQAREWHALAILRLKQALARHPRFSNMPAAQVEARLRNPPEPDAGPELFADDGLPWNDRVPYCRNIPTAAMITEARR